MATLDPVVPVSDDDEAPLVVPVDDDDQGRPLVTLVVPAYNEEAILVANLATLSEYMDSLSDMYRWEMIVVNDGSSDETGHLAEFFAESHDNVVVLHHRTNFNLGQALRSAFNRAQGDYVVTIDCDLSYAPEHIGRLLTVLCTTPAKVVLASPYHPEGSTTNIPFLRRKLSRWANRFLSFTAKGDLSTLTGMVRGYDSRFLSTLNLKAMDTEINTEIIYKAQLLGAYIVEIPAHLDWTFAQTGGARRRSPVSLVRSTGSYLFSGFIFRPVLFFIFPGILMLIAAIYTLGWAAWRTVHYYADGTGSFDPRISEAVKLAYDDAPHTFFVGSITLILAIQFISIGILALQNRRYFEELFHLGTTVRKDLRARDRLR